MTKIKNTTILSLAGMLIGTGIYILSASAHSGAKGVVKQRMDLMGQIGKAQKSLAAMFSAKQPYNVKKVRAAAKTISGHGGAKMIKLFPKGSTQHPSEAVPAIWQNWQEFQKLAIDLEKFAEALAKNADNKAGGSAGEIMAGLRKSQSAPTKARLEMLSEMPPLASFITLGQTCKACHSKFREKRH